MPLFLSEQDVRIVLSMDDLIAAMHDALAQFSSGGVQQPLRTVLQVGTEHAFFGVMPADMRMPPALGTKLVTVFGSNPSMGLPTHLATIVLLDPSTGELLAVMDGRYITEARTAAVSAVSAKLLAREDAGVLAIIGSGVQARSHLEAIRHVRRLADVRVWSPSKAHREAFAVETREATGLAVRPMPGPADAVRGADLIVLATASKTPVIDDADVAEGAHIAAVGACRPTEREMPTSLVARSRVFVDSRAGALQEAGELLLPIAEGAISESHIAGELGEVAAGSLPGRSSASDVTIFKSLGMAVEDVVAARLVLDRATSANLGQQFSFT